VTFISFAGIGPLSNLSLTMVGDRDEFAALAEVKAFLQQIGKTDTLQVIDGADHFFIGYTTGIETVLLDHLSSTD
jgi:alpha/beta superfamily hydrolase